MAFQTSEWSGRPLPSKWCNLAPSEKGRFIRMLNEVNRVGYSHMPWQYQVVHTEFKRLFDDSERTEICKHLTAVGSVTVKHVPYTTYEKSVEMLYPKPNGGTRILPSVYGKLHDHWLRANGVQQPIDTMNDGHLENTLKLLNESHGNLIDRCTSFMGKMYHHFQHQPDIQKALEDICLRMQKLDVDEIYPIFKALAMELHHRKPEDVKVEFIELNIDDDLSKW